MSPGQAAPEPRPIPHGRPFRARIRVPPSKSVTNRYLNLALLARQPVCLLAPLVSDDTGHFLVALDRLGIEVERGARTLRLEPGPPPPGADLWCGESGTMARFLAAALTTLPGDWRLDGEPGLRRRPLAPLVEALRALGAAIEYEGREGGLPVRVRGGTLAGGSARLDAGQSSQYLSALLMAATGARREVAVETGPLVSRPYVDLTVAAMAAFGAPAEEPLAGRFRVAPTRLRGGRLEVEGDYSAACYLAAAATVSGGEVELEGLDPRSAQGDRRVLGLLERMGSRIAWDAEGRLRVRGGSPLVAVEADLSDLPDQVPTLAALAPFCRGTTRLHGIAHLRLKESDRLAACARELRRVGAAAEEGPDALSVPGVWSRRPPPSAPVTVDSHGDHRIAMSFAVLGLRRPGVSIAEPGVVAKSYPGFWSDLAAGAGG